MTLLKLALTCALLGGLCTPAEAAPARVPLAVTVNGMEKADVIGWVSEEGLWISEADARAWGLSTATDSTVEGKQVISLKGFGGKVRFDEAQLALTVTLDAAELTGSTRIDLQKDAKSAGTVTAGNGMLLDYSLGAGYFSGKTTLDGMLHTQASWQGWQLLDTHSALLRSGALLPGARRTTIRRDWQEQNRRLDLGDLDLPEGGLASWSDWRGIGLSSVNYGYNALQATRPSTALSTLVQFPSTADVYVNGVKQGSYAVEPGVFDVRGLRGFSAGATQVKAVLRDVYGNETVVEESRYVADNALGAGSSEYSFQLGRAPGSDGGLQLRGVYRKGVSERLTLTGRLDAHKGHGAAQLGAVVPFAGLGEFGANVMTGVSSSGPRPKGFSLSHQYTAQAWGTQLALSERPVPVLLGSGTPATQSLREMSAQASYATKDWGQFSARLAESRYQGNNAARTGELGWSKNLKSDLFMHAYLRRNSQAGASMQVMLVYQPGRGLALNSFTETGAGRTTQQLSLARPDAGDKTASWSVDGKSEAGVTTGGASLANYSNAGVLKTNVFTDGKRAAGHVGWQGAASISRGAINALARPSEAAILVDAAGLEGIGVLRNGTLVGRTDRTGHLMVGDLTGYEEVRVSLNENDIPADHWYSGSGTVTIRPAPGAVLPAAFDVRSFRSIALTVESCNAQGCRPLDSQTVVLDSEGGVQVSAPLKNGQALVHGLLTGRHTLRTEPEGCTAVLLVEKTSPAARTVRCVPAP